MICRGKPGDGMMKAELMSPAGSWESLYAAMDAGADSVYFGVEQLNMRSGSSARFSIDEIPVIVRACRKRNVKSYVALNTILYDHDISLMRSIIKKCKVAGVNAVIAADHAAMDFAKQNKMLVHISTQANITNIETVNFYSQYADAVVLSRELTLEQVKGIVCEIKRRKITGPSGHPVKVEIFVHGALCMAVSGKCYMSLHTHFASANRGACIQNCRRSYIVTDKGEGFEFELANEYIMSAKDLCTIDFISRIIESGAGILKIEGRGRSVEYVHTVTQCYREAIDLHAAGDSLIGKTEEWKKRLSTVFNRGFWEGYYLGRKMGEWNDSAGSKATRKKIYVGKGIKYFGRPRIAEFILESGQLALGDEYIISGPATGIIKGKVRELRLDDKPCERVGKGDIFSTPIAKKIRPFDKLYKVVDAS